jgi:hypothetical protein
MLAGAILLILLRNGGGGTPVVPSVFDPCTAHYRTRPDGSLSSSTRPDSVLLLRGRGEIVHNGRGRPDPSFPAIPGRPGSQPAHRPRPDEC